MTASVLGFISAGLNMFKMLLESPQSMVTIVRKAHSEDQNELYTQYKHSDSKSQTERTGEKMRLSMSPAGKTVYLPREPGARRDFRQTEPRTSSVGRRNLEPGEVSRFGISSQPKKPNLQSHSFGYEKNPL